MNVRVTSWGGSRKNNKTYECSDYEILENRLVLKWRDNYGKPKKELILPMNHVVEIEVVR